MQANDLQIGDTWTDPGHRGKGLAASSIQEIVARCARPGRAFWYLVDDANSASIKAVERAGFSLAGEGRIQKRFGLGILGEYVMDEANPR